MSTLVIARGQWPIHAVLAVLHGDGFEATGTTTATEALSRLQAGGMTALLIGGGVEQTSRETLQQAAAAAQVRVVEAALGGRDVKTYVRDDLEPQLREANLPDGLAVYLAAAVSDELGATPGILGITAGRAIFAGGPVDGATVLVHGCAAAEFDRRGAGRVGDQRDRHRGPHQGAGRDRARRGLACGRPRPT